LKIYRHHDKGNGNRNDDGGEAGHDDAVEFLWNHFCKPPVSKIIVLDTGYMKPSEQGDCIGIGQAFGVDALKTNYPYCTSYCRSLKGIGT
jgi:hypothetical protein